jgi:hypothetical protein
MFLSIIFSNAQLFNFSFLHPFWPGPALGIAAERSRKKRAREFEKNMLRGERTLRLTTPQNITMRVIDALQADASVAGPGGVM